MSLAAIRARLQAQDNRARPEQQATDNNIYPFWNINEGDQALIRFLPDGDSTNDVFFWVERNMIRLPFQGVKGKNDAKEYVVQVPCVEMYGDNCPILAEVRTWYKDKSLEDMANKYWKKRTYLFQGFVRQSPLNEERVPENPIRRFIISPQIFSVIKSSLMDPEIEEKPTDYMRGLDFKIVKTTKGGYADYSTSGWARKESALTDSERAAIEQYGLYNLSEFLPKKPSESELRIIKEMFDASVDGRPYDLERWGAYYKPWGLTGGPNKSDDGDVSKVSVSVSRPDVSVKESSEVEETTPPWESGSKDTSSISMSSTASETAPVPSQSAKTNDILAMIRSRQSKSA